MHTVDHFGNEGLIQQRSGDNLDVFCVFAGKVTYSFYVKRRNFWVSCFPRQCKTNR